MALPKLNENPQFELTVPSMNKLVHFRPFLVKEEKVMLMAMESNDQKHILKTIVNTIDACVEEDLDVSRLTTFDVEYCFLQIRSKSVGETSKIKLECKECKTENEVTININDIKINVPKLESMVELTKDIHVELAWPSFENVLSNNVVDAKSEVDQAFNLIRSSIVAIQTNEERFLARDHKKGELDDFVESMTQDQFAKLRNYIEQMPRLKHDVTFCCINCAASNTITVEGMQSFFS